MASRLSEKANARMWVGEEYGNIGYAVERLSQVLTVNQDVLAVYSCVDGQQHHLGDASAEVYLGSANPSTMTNHRVQVSLSPLLILELVIGNILFLCCVS